MPGLAGVYRETVRLSLPFLQRPQTLEDDVRRFAEDLFPRTQFWLAEDETGEPVGYIAFSPVFIEHLFVLPSWQGRGLGGRLLAKAKADATELSLWTFQANHRGRRFYERQGFVAVMETDGLDNAERTPDVLYRWTRAGPSS
jgi:GNAT superfamily N-acetyltransferase